MEQAVHNAKLSSDLYQTIKGRAICKRVLTRYQVQVSVGTRTLQKQTVGKPTRGEARPCLEINQAHMKNDHEPIIVSHQGTEYSG